MIATIIFIFICILISGFFSGAETALVSINRIKLRTLADEGSKRARIIRRIVEDTNLLLGTTLVGTNIAVVLSSALFTSIIVARFGFGNEWIAAAVMAPVMLIFGEIIPKVVFRHNADTIMLALAYPMDFCSKLFRPLSFMATSLANLILRLFGYKGAGAGNIPFVTRQELRSIIQESERQGVIDRHKRSIIYRIFEFGQTTVKEVMVPLNRVVSLNASVSVKHIEEVVRKTHFSRIPIYDETPERLIGLVNVFDLFSRRAKERSARECIRKCPSVSEDMPIDRVLVILQRRRQPMGIVRNSEGRAIGIVTMEDLMEEIVGEI